MLTRHITNTSIRVVRNPLETDVVHDGVVDIRASSRPLSPLEPLKIGFVGRLSQEKGLLAFLSTLREVPLPWELHVYGDGPLRGALASKASVLGLTNRVVFHGHIAHSQVPSILKALSVVVVPSRWYENAPLAVLEAATAGTPTLVNDLGGLAEMSALTAASEVCQLDDPSQTTRSLENLAEQAGTNKILAPTDFTPEAYAASLADAYQTR